MIQFQIDTWISEVEMFLKYQCNKNWTEKNVLWGQEIPIWYTYLQFIYSFFVKKRINWNILQWKYYMMWMSMSRVFPGDIFVVNSDRILWEIAIRAPSDSSMPSYLRLYFKSILLIAPFRIKYSKNKRGRKKEINR